MGKWFKVNGEAFYGTGPIPFPAPPAAPAATGAATTRGAAAAVWDWRATSKLDEKKNGKIYLHVFKWPADGQFTVPQWPNGPVVKSAYLLADPARRPLGMSSVVSGAVIMQRLHVPKEAPDSIASVICLEVEGAK
jgi:alpha-L-fucosidase